MRLIDADALCDQLIQFQQKLHDTNKELTANQCIAFVENAPTVDAVEVVRCYECFQSEPCLKKNSVYCNKLHDAVMRDWFCADGEREK